MIAPARIAAYDALRSLHLHDVDLEVASEQWAQALVFRLAPHATLLAPVSYAADTIWLLILAALSWRMTRAAQMATQYYWLFERTGPFSWKPRPNVQGTAP